MSDTTPVEIELREDAIVLDVLASAYPALLSLDEVAREVGDQLVVTDALARLHGAGLVHRLDGFVWLTRAAVRTRAVTSL